MGTEYDIIFPDTIYTYEAVLGDIVTKLMPWFASSAGTVRGAKPLVFPDVDSGLTVPKQLYHYKINTLCTLYLPRNVYFNYLCMCPEGPLKLSQCILGQFTNTHNMVIS